MIYAILNYEFMKNAFIAVVLASIICGIMGSIIVEKKLVSMSGGIAHSSFGGIGAGYFLNIEPIIGGLIFAIIASISVSKLKRKTGTGVDTVVSMFWSGGMALGILLIALTPGYPPDMTSYLFGDILTVNNFYILVMVFLAIVTVVIIFGYFNYWKLYLFDEEYAKIMKINTSIMEYVLYALIACSIVVLIKVVGIILAIALLTIPPAIAKLFSYKLKNVIFLSIMLGVIFGICGIVLSYYLNIPSGATIIMVAIIFYALAIFISKSLKN